MHKLGRALLLVGALLALPSRAHAFVLSEDPFEERSLELGGAVRNYTLLLSGGPLDSPLVAPDDDPAALSALALRPEFELKRSGFDWVLHDEFSTLTSTLDATGLGGPLPLGQDRTTPLWLPLESTLVDHSRVAIRNRIDWAYVRGTFGGLSVTLGRQPVTLGRGQLWTPEDLLVPFSPLQLDTEYKPGIDAARVDFTLSDRSTLLVVGSLGKVRGQRDFEFDHEGSAALLRFEQSLEPLRLGVQAGDVHGDGVGALDLFWDLGHGVDVHGEGTLHLVPKSSRRPHGRKVFERAVLGSTFQPASHWLGTVELYFNGSGARRAADYAAEFTEPRVVSGEAPNVGRMYAGVALQWEAHPLLNLRAVALSNLEDGSALLAPGLDYSFAENAQLVTGAYLAVGRSPRYEPLDIVARSEFGMYPNVYHVDAKIYF